MLIAFIEKTSGPVMDGQCRQDVTVTGASVAQIVVVLPLTVPLTGLDPDTF
jgi:hypothetical protein